MKKKTLSKKLNDLIEKAGQANRYQFSLMICFLLQVMCCEMLNISLPSLEATPYVFVKNSQESERLTYKYCKILNITKDNKLDERPFDIEKKVTSIVIDYKLYCDSFKVYMISTFFYSGIIIGSSTCYMFADKIGRKKTLITFIPIYICLLILFFLNELLNKNYYLTLIFLFFIGITIYTITITLIIYLCEIIKHKTIPIFLAVVLLGLPLSGMICDLIFYYIINDWKYILLILAFMNSIVYIIMSFIIVNSPIYFLTNGDVKNFIESIKIIAKINRKTIYKEDYAFLEPFLNENKNMNNIINSHIINDEDINKNKNIIENNNNIDNDDEENKMMKKKINNFNSPLIDDKSEESEKNKSFDIVFGENNKREIQKELDEKNKNKNMLKSFVLRGKKNPLDILTSSLIGKYRMKDYTPLDIIRNKSQVSNFLILIYLWVVSIVIKDGINIKSKTFKTYYSIFYYDIASYIFDLISNLLIILLTYSKMFGIHKTQVSFQIISFVLLMICLFNNENSFSEKYILLLYVSKICWTCIYLILYILTVEIYPTMIRTKGVGINKAVGKLGGIIGPYLVENLDFDNLILSYLTFALFGLILSYGLPSKMGSLTIEYHQNEKEKKDFENYHLNEIMGKDDEENDNEINEINEILHINNNNDNSSETLSIIKKKDKNEIDSEEKIDNEK